MAETLQLVRSSDPILRRPTRRLTTLGMESSGTHELIRNMLRMCEAEQYGVGLSAPQVGIDLAVSAVAIKPTPTTPNSIPFRSALVNPAYIGIGPKVGMWEGCLSLGAGGEMLYGRAMRFLAIYAMWNDEHGVFRDEIIPDFRAQVFQHETDHLDGVLFDGRVEDKTTLMTADEYRELRLGGYILQPWENVSPHAGT